MKTAKALAAIRATYRVRIDTGLCGICGKPRTDDRTRCDKCRASSGRRCRQWNAVNTARVRNRNLVRHYGITLIQWEMMFDAQGRVCALCGTDKPGTKGWQMDHCHDVGALRAILCGPCNLGLGCFKDDPYLMARAITYLRKYRIRAVA